MKQYRIIRENSRFGWQYIIQNKLFGLFWVTSTTQSYNRFDLIMVQDKIKEEIKREKGYIERKKMGNGVI